MSKSNRANDDEINRILNEFGSEAQSDEDSELGDMAKRYGIDTDSFGLYGGSERYEPDYSFDNGRSRVQKPEHQGPIRTADGQIVLYDEDLERQKKQGGDAKNTTNGIRVIYDADLAGSQTAAESPFESFTPDEPLGKDSDVPKKKQKKDKNGKLPDKVKKSKKGKKPENPETAELSTAQKVIRIIFPVKGDPRSEKIRKTIMDISFVVLMVCSVFMVNYFIDLYDAVNLPEKIQDAPTVPVDENEQAWAAIKAKYPDIEFPEGMQLKFADLYAVNQDFAGRLIINNTGIDTPIVLRSDDPSNIYYLRRNFYKQNTKYGNPYLDYRNNMKKLDQNTIIYGHNMTDGLLFNDLEKYMTPDGFKDSPVIYFNTLYKDCIWKVYAVFITNGDAVDDNGYIFNCICNNFPSKESYQGYIDAVNERALYTTGAGLTTDDKVLTLSTCSYEYDNARLIVVARLLRKGESAEVDVNDYTVNENPRYPQAWYDAHGTDNPFADAFRYDPYA